MKHPNGAHLSEKELWDYIDDPNATPQLEEHVDTCVTCKGLVQKLRSIETQIKSLERFEPSLQFTSRVMDKMTSKAITFPWFVGLLMTSFVFVLGFTISQLIRERITFTFDAIVFSSFFSSGCGAFDLEYNTFFI